MGCEQGDKIEHKLNMLSKIIVGNGEMGIAEQARRAFEFKQSYTKSKNGWIDWTFRAIILVLLSVIVHKLGLK